MQKWNFVLAIVALTATGTCFAQAPNLSPAFRALRAQQQPAPIRPVSVSAQQVAAKAPVPAQFAGHHHQGGCASCGSAPVVSSGCDSCGGPGFVGDCCPNYMHPRAMGVWNSYCGSLFGHGCGMRGGCCNKVPIGMYGATPYGCCLAGVGFGKCGQGCGTGGCASRSCGMGGCGMGCLKSCNTGCKSFGWRWGVGGCGCDGSVGCGSSVGCTDCAANASAPSYDVPAQEAPQNLNVPHEAAPMDMTPSAPEAIPAEAPSIPTSQKSAFRLFKTSPSF